MSITFERSAWSSILSEARDFSCAVYDANLPPNALCVFDGLPIHVNAQPIAIAEVSKFFGQEEIYDGDIIMVNSVYYGTTHCGDLVVACPVFYEGEHLFWTVATGHQMDIGSPNPTSVAIQATDVWSEGFQISPIKLEEKGKLRKDVLQLYLENLRYREFLHGDLMSQVGSVKTGKKRLLELLGRWGANTLKQFAREITAYADRRTREEIAKWPDGTYAAESWVDSDGTGLKNIAIKCQLKISNSDISIDFTGSDPQVRGSTNASWATCQNAASIPILACLDPDIPHNQGCLRHVNVFAPKGTVTNVEWPGCASEVSIAEFVKNIDLFIHGTTIATNTVIQRNGPKIGIIHTNGFRDILFLRDGFKSDRYNLHLPPPDPFIPRYLRLGVEERILSSGTVHTVLNEDSVRAALEKFKTEGVQSITVCLLWSMMNPAHEQRIREILKEELPDVYVALSSDILPALREWPRACATTLSAYAGPVLGRYLTKVEGYLEEQGYRYNLLIMQVTGGSATVAEIEKRPVLAIGSGPAAAPAAGLFYGAREKEQNLMVVDMGGTSFDVSLITDGTIPMSRDLEIEHMPIGVAAVDVHSVGAGGGSIAWTDTGGMLRVGPQSSNPAI